ncbi:patatin-like phospholipase family protein [Aquimonas sp.]|uniref:patatin-like phospholipase family protein n=1 Tax=Aquimonas sp. TaxID=1872588 RepID=UPI0037BEFE87
MESPHAPPFLARRAPRPVAPADAAASANAGRGRHRRPQPAAPPFDAVAADTVNGERAATRGGDLALAKRASMAVPGVFAPIRVDGRLVVDGGPAQNR